MNKHHTQSPNEKNVSVGTGLSEGFAISGATVIDIKTGSKALLDIVIQKEKIVQIAPHGSLELPVEMQVIDATGQYVIPGLCDMHIHTTAWPEFKDQLSPLLIANGITSVRDMGGNLEDILAFRKQATEPGAVAPRLWIAGPIIDGSPRILTGDPQYELPDISVAVDTPEEAISLVDELVKCDIDFIKPYEMLLPEVFKALLQQAQAHQLPSAGHQPMRMTIPQVLDIGQYDIQHLGGSCSCMSFECVTNPERLLADKLAILKTHKAEISGMELMNKIRNTVTAPLSEQDPNRRSQLIQRFVEEQTWHTPTLVIMAGIHVLGLDKDERWLNSRRYLPKSRRLNYQQENYHENDDAKAWSEWRLETVGEMHRAGVKFLAGTDCPPVDTYTPGFCLHFELKALVLAGLSPLAALQAATINPAEFFNITDEIGSVEVGKYADLVLLEADPLADISNTQRIVSVTLRGDFFERKSLDKLLYDSLDGPGSGC